MNYKLILAFKILFVNVKNHSCLLVNKEISSIGTKIIPTMSQLVFSDCFCIKCFYVYMGKCAYDKE